VDSFSGSEFIAEPSPGPDMEDIKEDFLEASASPYAPQSLYLLPGGDLETLLKVIVQRICFS